MRQMADWFTSQVENFVHDNHARIYVYLDKRVSLIVVILNKVTRSHSWKGTNGRSFRSSFQEESWKRYNRRMQEAYEEEMERVVSLI